MSRLDRSIVAYAFLAQAQRAGDDLLSGLMPIFKPIAKSHEGKVFEPEEFARLAAELYGLQVSPWAVEGLAPRLEKAGVLTKVPVAEGLHKYVYSQISEEYTLITEGDVGSVLNAFVDFANGILVDKNTDTFSDDELKEHFLQHIVDVDFVGALLKPVRENGDPEERTLTLPKSSEQRSWEEDKTRRAKIDILCAAFVVEIHHNDLSLYELVSKITAGALISEVVLNFQNPEVGVSLKFLRIVLDAPLVMNALDLADSEAYSVSASICDQLRENGARLAIFRHSVEEIKDNLSAVINAVEAGVGHGPTARRLSSEPFRAYATAIRNSPEARLKQAGIEVIEAPADDAAYQFFTDENESDLFKALGYYQNRRAQERDAASVAGVVRLRKGTKVSRGKFHQCKTLFVTSNPLVASQSQTLMVQTGIYTDGEVPAVLTDRYLAGLLWVLYGGKAVELPTHVLLANCAAAVEPKADLIKRMHRFLSEIDEEKAKYFRALMTVERSARYLSQVSLGDSEYISSDNVEVILEKLEAKFAEKHEIERQKEREQHDKETEKLVAESQAEQERLNNQVLDARAQMLQVENANKMLLAQIKSIEEEMRREREQQEDMELQTVKWCVEQAGRIPTIAHFLLASVLSLIAILLAITSVYSPYKTMRFAGVLGGGIIVYVSFWKNPEKLFGQGIESARFRVLRYLLKSRGISDSRLSKYDIDWTSRSVSRR